MCTVYLWIGFAVNLARFLVPHYSYFTVAAREKKFRIISTSPSIDSSAFEDAPSISQSRNL
jgi:hypothetical protein